MKCIEDEIPFDVPDGWEWCRISSVALVVTDGEHKTPKRCNEYQGYYLLSARNIQNGYLSLDDVDYVDEEEYIRISKRCNPRKNDVLLSCSGSLGRVTVVTDEKKYTMVRSAAMIRFLELDPFFEMQTLQSTELQTQIQNSSKQTAQANLFQGAILSLLIPVPPLCEQTKISNIVSSIIKKVENINNEKNDLANTIQLTKSKILNLAIQGKLVPQNLDDEPASVLLKRIRTEKDELIKAGKIKRDKKESVIFRGDDNSYYESVGKTTICIDGEIPFKIPETWTWCRLKNLADFNDNSFVDGPFGSDLKTIHYTQNKEVRIVQLNNIGSGGWKNSGEKYTTFKHADKIQRCVSYPGDIVIAKMMPAGRAIILPKINNQYVISSDCVRIRLYNAFDKDYVINMLNSPKINMCVLKTVQGIGRTRTSLNKMKDLLIPIPPINTQIQIADTITNYNNYLQQIAECL